MTTISTVTVPELTAEQVQAILVRPLEQASVFLAAGPRIFDTNGSPVRVPKLGGATAPDWIAENEEITEVDVDFDEITLLPSTMKSVKTLTRFSNELARQSVIALDAALQDRLVTDVASKLDAQMLGDSGDGVETPKGLFVYAGQELPIGGALELDDLHDAWGLALAANVNIASLRWIMAPAEFVAVRKIKDLQDRYQLQPDPTADGVFRLLGAPVTITSRVPAGSAALVDFSQIAVARDLAPSVRILTERYADFDQQAIRVVARYDAAPMNDDAVIALTGIVSDGS
jgi:HK97 family phage major capsid protein